MGKNDLQDKESDRLNVQDKKRSKGKETTGRSTSLEDKEISHDRI